MLNKNVKISKKLSLAREYEIEALNKGINSPKQLFHFCVPVGWMNDPNGFSEFKAKKHLFFQYHPYSTNWGPMHWGHVVSDDFIKWENMPVALAPDEEYDEKGCFSGSAIEWKGKHILAYTGVNSKDASDYQEQCIAIGDGREYQKIESNPVITSDMLPEGASPYDFRDPKLWEDNGCFYMAVANRSSDGSGQILLFMSQDLEHWEYVNALIQNKNRYGKMWECPDFFNLDNKDILITSPQEIKSQDINFNDGNGTIYIIGEYCKNTFNYKEELVRPLDMGLDFYAPQTMKCSDGRRMLIGWMQSWDASLFDEKDGFCGMMTIPRQIFINNGLLCQLPVDEIKSYYKNETKINNIELTEELDYLEELSGRTQNIDITLNSSENYIFELRLAANDDYFSVIRYDRNEKQLVFDRSNSGIKQDIVNARIINTISNNDSFSLRILMDIYSIEMFINDGEQVLTSLIRTPLVADKVAMRAEGNVKINVIRNEIEV